MGVTTILSEAIVESAPSRTVLAVREADRVLFVNCEFRGITIIIEEEAKKAFISCLFRSCEISTPPGKSEFWLSGCNIALSCKINGKLIDDLRTAGSKEGEGG